MQHFGRVGMKEAIHNHPAVARVVAREALTEVLSMLVAHPEMTSPSSSLVLRLPKPAQQVLPVLLHLGDVQAIGNVHIVNGDMVIDAEHATYHQADPNNIFITASGAPITYRGKLEDGSPFTGRSKHLRYMIKKAL